MSYFLCLAVPAQAAILLNSAFAGDLYISDISEIPFGRAAIAGNKGWSAYMLQIEASSASLIAKGAINKKSRHHDRSTLFVSGVSLLFDRTDVQELNFLAHWMQGYITTEDVAVQDSEYIPLSRLQEAMRNMREDVLYTVRREHIVNNDSVPDKTPVTDSRNAP